MKRSIIFLLLCFISIISFSQKRITVANWDNEIYFQNSRNPVIKNYGPLSDSLSSTYDVDFLFYDDKYFALNSWADYYYWYSQRFWYLLPFTYSLYEYYYHTKNNFGMVGIVVGNSYLGRYYPSYITIEIEDENMLNRLSTKRTPNT